MKTRIVTRWAATLWRKRPLVVSKATLSALVAMWLAGSASTGRAAADGDDVPVTFASATSPVAIRLQDAVRGEPVALHAFGRIWGAPVTPRNGSVELALPTVRVPISFDLVPVTVAGQPRTLVPQGRVVVYPGKHRLTWNERMPLFVESGAPAWIREWLNAVGLPATQIKQEQLPGAVRRPDEAGGVLILGRQGSGPAASELAKRLSLWKINVLVVDADWFGKPIANETLVIPQPERFHHALGDLGRQTWPQVLRFHGVAGPWPGIVNRWVWMDSSTTPLLEEVRAAGNAQRIVLSYLPWSQQLGVDAADALFLSVLQAAARVAGDAPVTGEGGLGRDFELVWPPADQITATARPVLARCLREQAEKRSPATADNSSPAATRQPGKERRPPLFIVDLRGPDLSESDAAALPAVLDKGRQWLILGSDRGVLLSRKDEEKLNPDSGGDSTKAGSLRHGVLRLEDDALPSSTNARIRLMQMLTDNGISIGTINIFSRNEP